jgi:hypothetical protein
VSPGLWVLLALVAVGQLAALGWRRRALRARTAAANRPGLYFLTSASGEVHFGSNPAIAPGTIIVGQIPRMTLAEGPLFIERDAPDVRAWLRQEFVLGLEAAGWPITPINVTGV